MTREEFWRQQLGPYTAATYANYLYPNNYKKDLKAIADFCRNNGIRLAFIIFPTHVELQRRILDFHLEEVNARFRQDLASMATTYDYDYVNEITLPKKNFRDPYHFTDEVRTIVIREIWGGANLQYARKWESGMGPAY